MIPPNILVINVTANDLEHGVARSPFGCPVARACARALWHYGCKPTVGLTGVHCVDEEGSVVAFYALPFEGMGLVMDFDTGNGLAHPQVFTLERMS